MHKVVNFSLAAVVLLSSGAAFGQSARTVGIPEVRPSVDDNFVNLMSGKYALQVTELELGPLAFIHQWVNDGWRHNMALQVTYDSSRTTVSLGDSSRTFLTAIPADGVVYSSEQGDGSTLVRSPSAFTFTERDGTVYVFDRTSYSSHSYYGYSAIVATTITRPSGEVLSLSYKKVTSPNPWGSANVLRLQAVMTSFGYQMKFNYPSANSYTISSVNIINSAVDYCNPAADSCSGFTQPWPTVSFSETTPSPGIEIDQVTNALGQSTYYTITQNADGVPFLTGIRRPLDATDSVTITYRTNKQLTVQSVKVGNDTWGYMFTKALSWPAGTGRWTAQITNPLAKTTIVNGEDVKGTIWYTKDALNNTISYQFGTFDRPERVTSPEGNYTQITYDARGNVSQSRKVAKAGSGLADIVESAIFPASCSNSVTCNQASSVTDANGSTRSFTYDSNHGGVLTETGPAVDGIAPVSRSSYLQRYAWIKNGAGSFVQSGAPIWLLAETRTCNSTATVGLSCAGGPADEVVTTYDYGPNSGPNNLAVRGVSVTADGQTLRTCFGYDAIGRKISETKPNANLTSCP